MMDSDNLQENTKPFKEDYILKPSKEKPKIDTSKWPLLLKVSPSILININSLRILIN
jgi:hypothetical protein